LVNYNVSVTEFNWLLISLHTSSPEGYEVPPAITTAETSAKIMKNGDTNKVADLQITDTITHNTLKTGEDWLKFSSNENTWENVERIRINLLQYRHNAANKKCSGNTHFVSYQPTWWGKRNGYAVLAIFNCKDPASKALLKKFQSFKTCANTSGCIGDGEITP
jgi:hypothetical protein